ncbi:DUF4352 domain-containing protein [Peribacillus sp. FSL K6-1552]|uniref:DUF4352 domain-containing protein n=1 Tax=Peribacillus sp. FSL K6-1552 TaxID=2954514 RepID=UPI0030FBC577
MKKIGKFIFMALGIIIALSVIGSFMGGEEETSDAKVKEADSTQTKDNKTDSSKKETKVYKIGDKVKVGKLAYKITNAESMTEIKSNNEFIESAKTDGQFLVIDIEAFNNDKEARMVDSSMFKVKDNQGREFEPSNDSDVMMVLEETMDLFLQDINPGISKKGKLVFELPKDSSTYSIEVSSGLGWAGGEYEKIKLK